MQEWVQRWVGRLSEKTCQIVVADRDGDIITTVAFNAESRNVVSDAIASAAEDAATGAGKTVNLVISAEDSAGHRLNKLPVRVTPPVEDAGPANLVDLVRVLSKSNEALLHTMIEGQQSIIVGFEKLATAQSAIAQAHADSLREQNAALKQLRTDLSEAKAIAEDAIAAAEKAKQGTSVKDGIVNAVEEHIRTMIPGKANGS